MELFLSKPKTKATKPSDTMAACLKSVFGFSRFRNKQEQVWRISPTYHVIMSALWFSQLRPFFLTNISGDKCLSQQARCTCCHGYRIWEKLVLPVSHGLRTMESTTWASFWWQSRPCVWYNNRGVAFALLDGRPSYGASGVWHQIHVFRQHTNRWHFGVESSLWTVQLDSIRGL